MRKVVSLLSALSILLVSGCVGKWTADEKRIINSEADTLHVYTVDDPQGHHRTDYRIHGGDFSARM